MRWSYTRSSAEDVRWGGNPPTFGLHRRANDRGEYDWSLFVRHWLVLAACAIAPLAALTRHLVGAIRRSRTTETARCHTCGYDLRATPDRCPECGIAVGQTCPQGRRPQPRAMPGTYLEVP